MTVEADSKGSQNDYNIFGTQIVLQSIDLRTSQKRAEWNNCRMPLLFGSLEIEMLHPIGRSDENDVRHLAWRDLDMHDYIIYARQESRVGFAELRLARWSRDLSQLPYCTCSVVSVNACTFQTNYYVPVNTNPQQLGNGSGYVVLLVTLARLFYFEYLYSPVHRTCIETPTNGTRLRHM